MENHHFQWENPLLMVIFNSYVKLPEGISTRIHPKAACCVSARHTGAASASRRRGRKRSATRQGLGPGRGGRTVPQVAMSEGFNLQKW